LRNRGNREDLPGCLWAKTPTEGGTKGHPLPLHLLDVAACADAVLEREPETTRQRMAEIFGLPWEQARPLLLLLIASHDIGKACPGFQMKWDGFRKLQPGIGLRVPISVDTNINHAFVTQICLSELLQSETRWAEEFAHLAADAVGSHHGERCGPARLERLGGNRRALGGDDWSEVRRSIFHDLLDCFKVGHSPSKEKINGPGFMLLAGLTSFADWIGSNEMWFGFGIPKDCLDLPVWWDRRREIADKALDSIGWFPLDYYCNFVMTAVKPPPEAILIVKASAGPAVICRREI